MSTGTSGVAGPQHADLTGLVAIDIDRIRTIDAEVPSSLQTATFATG